MLGRNAHPSFCGKFLEVKRLLTSDTTIQEQQLQNLRIKFKDSILRDLISELEALYRRAKNKQHRLCVEDVVKAVKMLGFSREAMEVKAPNFWSEVNAALNRFFYDGISEREFRRSLNQGIGFSQIEIDLLLEYLEMHESVVISQSIIRERLQQVSAEFPGCEQQIRNHFLTGVGTQLCEETLTSADHSEYPLKDVEEALARMLKTQEKTEIKRAMNCLGLEVKSDRQILASFQEYAFIDMSDSGSSGLYDKARDYLGSIQIRSPAAPTNQANASLLTAVDWSLLQKMGNSVKTLNLVRKLIPEGRMEFTFKRSDFGKKLTEMEFIQLRASFLDMGLMTSTLHHSLTGKGNCHVVFEEMLHLIVGAGGRIAAESLPLKNKKQKSAELWLHLLDKGIIKRPKVNLPWASQPKKALSKMDEKVKELFPSKHQTICATLRFLAGELRTSANVREKALTLKEAFEGQVMPDEAAEYWQMGFHRLVCTEQYNAGDTDVGIWICAALGVAQICVGVSLYVFSCGLAHPLADLAIAEGVSDLVYSAQSYFRGGFSWQGYRQHKIQSVAISALCIGVSATLHKLSLIASAGPALAMGPAIKGEIFKAVMSTAVISAAKGILHTAVNYAGEKVLKLITDGQLAEYIGAQFEGWLTSNRIYNQVKQNLISLLTKVFMVMDRFKDIAEKVMTMVDEALQLLDSGKQLYNSVMSTASTVADKLCAAINADSNSGTLSDICRTYELGNKIISLWKKIKEIQRFFELAKTILSDIIQKMQLIAHECQSGKGCLEKARHSAEKFAKKIEAKVVAKVKQCIKHAFISPLVKQTLQGAIDTMEDMACNAMDGTTEGLKEDFDDNISSWQQANRFIDHEMLQPRDCGAQKRRLAENGIITELKSAIQQSFANEPIANLEGYSIAALQQNYHNVRVICEQNKLYAVLPTFKQVADEMEKGGFAGAVHIAAIAKFEQCEVLIASLDELQLDGDGFLINESRVQLTDSQFNVHLDVSAPGGGHIRVDGCTKGKHIFMLRSPAKEEGAESSYIPVIALHGKLKAIRLNQELGMSFCKACLAVKEAAEQIEKNNGRIDEVAIMWAIQEEHLSKYCTDVARYAKGCCDLREMYERGSDFLEKQQAGILAKTYAEATHLYSNLSSTFDTVDTTAFLATGGDKSACSMTSMLQDYSLLSEASFSHSS